MGFGALKVKAKAKSGRGSLDASAICDAVKDSWDDLQAAINGMTDDQKEDLKKHFNEFGENDDVDGLGDVLFGEDCSEFETKVSMLDDDVATKYTKELIAQ